MDYMIIEDSSNVPYTYKGNHDTYLQYAQGSSQARPCCSRAMACAGHAASRSSCRRSPCRNTRRTWRRVSSIPWTTSPRAASAGTASPAATMERRRTTATTSTGRTTSATRSPTNSPTWSQGCGRRGTRTRWSSIPAIPMFADGKKVRPINHEGKYFKVRGPLNAPRSPQGRVPIVQAGGSAAGKKFASKWADTIITEGSNIEKMKEYRQEVRRNAAAIGRNPDDIKLLFLCSPIVDTTMDAARERRRLQQEDSLKHVEMQLSGMSRLTGIDFSKFDLDEPLPLTLTTNGHQSSLARWLGKPLREIVRTYASKGSLDYTGTPDHVAGSDAGHHGGGGWRRLSDIRYPYRPSLCDGGLRWAGARVAAPWPDPQGLRAQASRRQSKGILRPCLVRAEP